MKSKSILGAAFTLLFITFGASAGTVPLDVTSYNFQLAGGGGGAAATLNGVTVEIFCDDFDNDIYVPSNNTANVTTLSTSANLNETRFGNVSPSAWTQFTTLGATDDAFFNSGSGSSGLARYEMVAYLVSFYNVNAIDTTADNQIQEAIWSIMDPTAEGAVIDPSGLSGDSYLEQAATWYMGMSTAPNQAALNNFLSHFEVVSDSTMTFSNGLGQGGFQEQIVDPNPIPAPSPVPEPRNVVWMLGAFFALGAFLVQRTRNSRVHATN
jgi:hypothetical protein